MTNLLLVMAIYTLTRVFFYLTSRDLFPDVTCAHLWEMLLGGMRFDLTAVLYLSSVYLLMVLLPLPQTWRLNRYYQTAAKWFFLLPNLLGIAVNCIDMVYVRFTDRRTTITFFDEFSHDGNLLSIFCQGIVQYWYVTLFALAVMGLLVLLFREYKIQTTAQHATWWYYTRESVLFVVSVYFIIIGIRGGFGAYTRPITLSNALQYTNRPQETLLVLNTPFSLMRSTEGSTYTDPHYYTQEEMTAIMTPEHEGRQTQNNEQKTKMNVVVLILESFSREFIGFYNESRGYTPFLDSLLAQSVTWTRSFASGRKSIDAMPSVLSSIPMLIEPYVVTPYSTNAVSSIADCLGACGYETAFFHGAPNGSMGFQAYARSAGFDAYYGMDEYPEASRDFDGTWAIWDEEFLQFYAQTMSSMPEPFMTAVFTASSHHPFRVPERYEGVFPQGTQPIHQCIGYSDNALRRFFDFARTQPWYDHTLFVLTADHTNQLSMPEYTNAKGLYEVPIAFFCPRLLPAEKRQGVISQTDIMPSVLGAVGYTGPYFAFGEDALTRPKTHPYAVCYNNPVFQIMSDSLLMQFDGRQVTALYNYVSDPLLQQPMDISLAPEPMLSYLKAYIQQYTTRMINNQLTYGSTD
ncbi:MAG: LTA synthase family protein [Paludibacteraceae bacterium]|nr:LTA synthase family protein [Paludibacteraceae bacterium]